MDNRRPRISSYSPSSRSSTTRTPHRPQRPKKVVKLIWVKKGSTVGSQAVLPQTVKKSAMISPKQTWKPKGNYLDSVNRGNGSYTLKQFEYGNPEEDLKDYAGDNHDRRSTSGGCQYLGRRLVSWQCKKQTIVAISSTEAEYVAAASCCAQDLYHLYRVVDDYYEHIPPTGLGLMLLGDLNIIWETAESSDDDFWKDQEEWI
ncbi:putative ribonuclease H-like domain-containing protein, partial [Tanacetum coccineum]